MTNIQLRRNTTEIQGWHSAQFSARKLLTKTDGRIIDCFFLNIRLVFAKQILQSVWQPAQSDQCLIIWSCSAPQKKTLPLCSLQFTRHWDGWDATARPFGPDPGRSVSRFRSGVFGRIKGGWLVMIWWADLWWFYSIPGDFRDLRRTF